MLYQFIFQNLHFIVNMYAALVFFSAFWLHLDAWKEGKAPKELLKFSGFLVLAISFLVHATFVESPLENVLSVGFNHALVGISRILGYILVILGLITDPIPVKPEVQELTKESFQKESHSNENPKKKAGAKTGSFIPSLNFTIGSTASLLIDRAQLIFGPLAFLAGFLYLRRSTVGLERHLRPVSFIFFVLSLSELVGLSALFQQTTNPSLFKIVSPFGVFWIFEHLVLLISVIILHKWVFGYLLRRFLSQIFIIMVSGILIIFVFTTVTFSLLLLGNFRQESLRRVETDVKVLGFAIERTRNEITSNAELIAQDKQILDTLRTKRGTVSDILETFLVTKDLSFLTVVDKDGLILGSGEDKERLGDSLSGDVLVKKALEGESTSSIVKTDGVLSSVVSIHSAVPIKLQDKVVGVVSAGVIVDNNFVDGVRRETGLQVLVYGDNQVSATTIALSEGGARLIGVKEERKDVLDKVLENGESFSGSVNLVGKPYSGAYLPLKSMDGKSVGMLFVGDQEINILRAASRSIELTFIITSLMLVLSVIPSYLISRYINNQIR